MLPKVKYKKQWRHPKFKNKTFTGHYDRRVKKNGEIDQNFYLLANSGKETRIDMESPAMAKKLGWELK